MARARLAGSIGILVLMTAFLVGCPWRSKTAPADASAAASAPAPPESSAAKKSVLPKEADEDVFMPGGMAVCPCSEGKKFILTDNTHGRIIQLDKDAAFAFRTTLLRELDNAGDVDIAEKGRAFVYVDGEKVVHHYFGLTAFVHDGVGAPLAGADVVIEGGKIDQTAKVDGDGMFTVFDLLPAPAFEAPEVTVTITQEGRSLQFPIFLDECCQTCREILFAPEEDPKGVLRVDVQPAALPGVRWRLKGVDLWLDADLTLHIYPGEYTVIFDDVAGYATPDPVTVLLAPNIVTNVEIEYVPL
jgi:hypothetical protein